MPPIINTPIPASIPPSTLSLVGLLTSRATSDPLAIDPTAKVVGSAINAPALVPNSIDSLVLSGSNITFGSNLTVAVLLINPLSDSSVIVPNCGSKKSIVLSPPLEISIPSGNVISCIAPSIPENNFPAFFATFDGIVATSTPNSFSDIGTVSSPRLDPIISLKKVRGFLPVSFSIPFDGKSSNLSKNDAVTGCTSPVIPMSCCITGITSSTGWTSLVVTPPVCLTPPPPRPGANVVVFVVLSSTS